jgi:hypothetical protein
MIKNPTCYKSFKSFDDENYAYEKAIRESILDLKEENKTFDTE